MTIIFISLFSPAYYSINYYPTCLTIHDILTHVQCVLHYTMCNTQIHGKQNYKVMLGVVSLYLISRLDVIISKTKKLANVNSNYFTYSNKI